MASRKYTSLPFIEKPVAAGNFSATGRMPIRRIVYHTTDGSLVGTLAWFNNSQAQASSNYVIDTNGQIYAMLEEYYVPYTNGSWPSNQESITIETIDNGNPWGPRTEAQIKACVALGRDIAKFYGLTIDRNTIKGHREIPPGTHPNCPGNLDLDRIAREAASGGNPTPTPATPNYTQAAKEAAQYVYGYKTHGTVTQRMAKIIEIFKKYKIPKP